MRPKENPVLTWNWIYKITHVAYVIIKKYKARFIAQGFLQKEGIDYEETFVSVARYISIRTILALEIVMKWKIRKVDIKTTCLNGVVEEEVYVEQPLGFETGRPMCAN